MERANCREECTQCRTRALVRPSRPISILVEILFPDSPAGLDADGELATSY